MPVYIWYKDIDFDQVDILAKKKTGLSPEDCEVVKDFPAITTLNGLKNGDVQAEAEMEQYLERTEEARRIEREKTNTYKSGRKEIARQQYNNKSDNVKKQLSLDDNNIVFSSQYAPMIIANMTAEEVEEASKLSVVEEIGYYEETQPENPSVNLDEGAKAKESMGLSKVYDNLGLSGKNVNVGLIEINIPGPVPTNDSGLEELEINLNDVTIAEDPNHIISPSITQIAEEHSHSYNTFRVMAGVQTGIAKDIDMYATNVNFTNIETLLTYDIDIIEMNAAYPICDKKYDNPKDQNSISNTNPEFSYSFMDKYYDHIISQHNITTVVAGGNTGEEDKEFDWYDESYENKDKYGNVTSYGRWAAGARITSPGMGYNVITVAGYDNNNTGNNPDDDWLENYSWKNKFANKSGCEKPDVIMPCNFPGRGTSVASPALTAEIALMFELKPSLSLHPQEVKAIVLASCHRKVIQTNKQGGQETMAQGITERQGAGAPDAWTMACIISQGTYGSGILNGTETNVDILQPSYGADNMNISITWIKENTAEVIEHPKDNYANITLGQTSNLDLDILQNNAIISSSSLANSSTEMCYFPISSTDFKYRLKIKQRSSPRKVRYGYAWSTDNMLSSSINQNGIYYIKSASSENNMVYNSSKASHVSIKNISSQNNLNDNTNWIVTRSNNGYTIKTGLGNIEEYVSEDNLSGSLIVDSIAYNIDLLPNNDGTYCIKSVANGKILCYNSGKHMWCECNEGTDTSALRYKWYFSKINYLPGDVNTDGTINALDVSLLQQYLAGLTTLNNKQMYLADVNQNGSINAIDVSALQLYISQM